ncbi:hypothetical protein XI09_28165 [Bradyrhizobium sp. CCBAU 11386]|uniref:toll/interleukin-1 receptor domain-containing protein n=1 Tax=Bradyrhizobium sp. CCBAU 11386 TaxID=1630837 RepID=UPI00230217FD|nr:toll/interleukin-1 receptor domain-containing protein [Bradyrhizobium sp. CCBAU 11386]MDA9508447.1 hypothetical protein [Bradyrhizobium sp. CCBAU 11386]
MTDKRVQFFMSYAWNDNRLPPGEHPDKQPFVATLAGQIEWHFNDAKPNSPLLWWDRDNIDDGTQFRPAIRAAIEASAFLVIVLSEHWLASEYCQLELQLFRERWRHESDFAFKHRIILAHKSEVPKERWPSLLPEQKGFQFFSRHGPYHWLGRASEEFYRVAGDLAKILIKRAKFEGEEPPQPPQPSRGLKVYLAKPAPDVRDQYLRVHRELVRGGYHVVPGVADDIPLDAGALDFIDRELKDARVSIHLLGRSAGPAPADLEHIAKLQLNKAAERIPATGADDKASFHRVIWAPKRFEEPSGQPVERDPIDTVKSFASQQPGDRIEGDSISPFTAFLLKHLEDIDTPMPPGEPSAFDHIYLCHDESDTEYAAEVATLLEEHEINYVMPAYYNTTDVERRQFHRERLSECTAVVMCWAKASEMWARAQSKELRSWQTLGRKQEFMCRGLIAGPPPHIRKDEHMLRHLFPSKEIDLVLNWTQTEKPSIEALRRIFQTNAEQRAHE